MKDQTWVIKDINGLFWSNLYGWTEDQDDAEIFYRHELHQFYLPIGGEFKCLNQSP